MSYNGGINFGLLADYDSMDDVDVIASGIETAIAELVDAAAAAAEQRLRPRVRRANRNPPLRAYI